jgi:quercetin dioxygenase-like cupin family protein
MSEQPVVANLDDRDWTGWPPHQVAERGAIEWKTLISRDHTASDTLSLGVARVAPGAALNPHRHEQAEVYLVLGGAGELHVGGAARVVTAGDAVFIPGGAVHGIACAGDEELTFAYAFATDSSADVLYDFAPGKP